MAETISNKAVAVLVIVTVIVTIAGTLFFVNGIDDFMRFSQVDSANGQVSLDIEKDKPVAIAVPKDGHVSLQIL